MALLVVLTAISVAMALLIPVITRKHTQIGVNSFDNSTNNGGFFICYKDGSGNLHSRRVDITNGAPTIKDESSCTFKIPAAKSYKVAVVGGGGGGAASMVEVVSNIVSTKKFRFGEYGTTIQNPFASLNIDSVNKAVENFWKSVAVVVYSYSGGGSMSNDWTDADGNTRHAKGESGNEGNITVDGLHVGDVIKYKYGEAAKYEACSAYFGINVPNGTDGYAKVIRDGSIFSEILILGGKSAVCDVDSATKKPNGQAKNACFVYPKEGVTCAQSESGAWTGASRDGTLPVTDKFKFTLQYSGSSWSQIFYKDNMPEIDFTLKNTLVKAYSAGAGKSGGVQIRQVPFLGEVGKNITISSSQVGTGGAGGKWLMGNGNGKDGTDTTITLDTGSMKLNLVGAGGKGGTAKENPIVSDKNSQKIDKIFLRGEDGYESGIGLSDSLKLTSFTKGVSPQCDTSHIASGSSSSYPGYGGAGACLYFPGISENAGYLVDAEFPENTYRTKTNDVTFTISDAKVMAKAVIDKIIEAFKTLVGTNVGLGGNGAGGAIIISW